MIPTFPASKPIELSDRRHIERITSRFEPYSDFTFPSLYCWDTEGSHRISTLHGNLVVRFKDYTSDAQFYGFIGDGEVVRTTQTLLAHARADGHEPCLRLIPDVVIAADERLRSAFVVAEDRANFDYVCSVREWAALVGSTFAKHRNKVQRCRRQYPLEARPLSLGNRQTRGAAMAVFDEWATGKDDTGIDRQLERTALERLFFLSAANQVTGCGLYDGTALRAFSVWDYAPRHRFSIHHFAKADHRYDGASSLLIHSRSCLLSQGGYEFANIEQDLGIPGLAAFKRSLRPCRFLRKFTVTDGSAAASGLGE